MGFKTMDNSLGFADLALAGSMKHNRILKFTQLNMFEEHLLRNLTGRAEYEINRNKNISKVRYIACPVE